MTAALAIGAVQDHRTETRGDGVGTTLYDIVADPKQLRPLRDEAIERRMILSGIAAEMHAHDAPIELCEPDGITA
jgi:hypothetical protein